jgi:hypothetical protein
MPRRGSIRGSSERLWAYQASVEKWWLNKWIRPVWDKNGKFQKVIAIKVHAPPSCVYASVEVTYEGDTQSSFLQTIGRNVYRPRKQDYEVKEEM